jgi:DNA ligase-1
MNSWESDMVFEAVEMVAKASGHTKRQFLHPAMMSYLVAAYNPYIRYYTKRKEEECVAESKNQFTDETWELLRKLSEREISGHDAEYAVDRHIAMMTPESSRLFIRILNKDLRMGLGAKSINKVFPNLIPTHDVMLAYRVDWSRVEYPCYISFKVDGVRATYKFGEFYSRKGIKFEGLDQLKYELKDVKMPLDGELSIPGVSFQVGSGLIRRNTPTSNALFSIFELPNVLESFPVRATMMRDMENYSEHVTALRQQLIHSRAEADACYELARRMGYEGLVLRKYNYRYVGNRSYSWMKIKPLMKDLELKVVDVYEGEGKYIGMLGGVIVEYHGSRGMKHVKVGSGFTDNQRHEYWLNPPIGQTIQAEAMEETDDGSLRHPIFKEVKE